MRISPKRDKPSPRIVYRHGRQDSQIKERKLIKNIISKLQAERGNINQ